MKYIKTYENMNIKIGDYVKCINNEGVSSITVNKLYKLTNIIIDKKTYNNYYQFEDDIFADHSFKSTRFVKATPEEIEKYELEKQADKYNL